MATIHHPSLPLCLSPSSGSHCYRPLLIHMPTHMYSPLPPSLNSSFPFHPPTRSKYSLIKECTGPFPTALRAWNEVGRQVAFGVLNKSKKQVIKRVISEVDIALTSSKMPDRRVGSSHVRQMVWFLWTWRMCCIFLDLNALKYAAGEQMVGPWQPMREKWEEEGILSLRQALARALACNVSLI